MKNDKIYFASSGGRIKIGVSRNVEHRLLEIGTHLPERLALLGTISGSLKEEEKIHRQLSRFHISGEWFRNCPELRTEIEKILASPVRDWIFVDNGRADRPTARGERALAPAERNDPYIAELLLRVRRRWPEKTHYQLATITRMSERACKHWFAGRNDPSAKAVRLIEKVLAQS